jgi:nucleoside-diphosphate-sugar epimerase
MATPRLFCFGLGYTARALARSLAAEDWRVAGTTRDPTRKPAPSDAEVHLVPFDGATPMANAARALAGTTHVLVSIPPGPSGDPVLACHATDLAAVKGLSWVGYLSTTGVYGDRAGGWVDEASECRPVNERSRNRLAAERAWLAWGARVGVPVHVFRLAGIYGPGRSALDTVRAGRAQRIIKAGQVFSRIHVADIVAVLRASIDRPSGGAVYNVCDDEAAPPQDVVAHACGLLGVTPPPEVPIAEAELSPMARSFYGESKRVRNERIKSELGVRLAYPDYRAGLAALLRSGA